MRVASPAFRARSVLFTCVAAIACTREPAVPRPPVEPVSLLVASGDNQTDTIGSVTSLALGARVVDARGLGIANVGTTWSVDSGDAVLEGTSSVLSDTNGVSRVQVRRGLGVGTTFVSARVGLLSARFTVNTTAGQASRAELISGDNQHALFNTAASDIFVQSIDRGGNVAEWPALEAVEAGGGHITFHSLPVPGSRGLVSLTWRMPSDTGLVTGWIRARNLPLIAFHGMSDGWSDQVSAGYFHTCALTSFGQAYCWGRVWLGPELQTYGYYNRPVRVSGSLRFASISVGTSHTCAVSTDGTAYCWGKNSWNALGTGDAAGSSSPRPVLGSVRFKQVAAEELHTCAVATTDEVYCWGRGAYGSLGMERTPLLLRQEWFRVRIGSGTSQ